MPGKIRVLVVGQTPPPYHGQAIMIERLLRGQFAQVELHHVCMAFSDSISDIGRFRLGKVFHLLAVIGKIIYCRLVHRTTILCYPPAGPQRVPLYRDLAILLCTRWMFRRTILYFHAGGVSQLYPLLNKHVQWLCRLALFNAAAAIRISAGSPDDGTALKAKHNYIVPNGIEDEYPRYAEARTVAHSARQSQRAAAANSSISADGNNSSTATIESEPLRILFVGILTQSKGISVLVEACSLLAARGVPFTLDVAGQFSSPEFAAQLKSRIAELGLEDHIHFLGQVNGNAKWNAFATSDVLCLPTFYEAETFGVVLVEAMSFALPVVATRWRGIPEIVDDGATGFLVNPHDAAALADRLEQLHADPALRRRFGTAGREKFLNHYTVDRYWQRIEQVFVETVASN